MDTTTTEIQIIQEQDIPQPIQQDVLSGYSQVSAKASEAIQKAQEILAKDTSDDAVALEARECRISLMRVRTETERTRKAMLRPVELHKKAISGAAAILTDIVSRKEKEMESIEEAYEQRCEQARQVVRDERRAAMETLAEGIVSLSAYDHVDLASKSNKEMGEIHELIKKMVQEAKQAAEAAEAERQKAIEEAKAAAAAAAAKAEEDARRVAEAKEEAERIAREETARRQAAEAEAAELRAKLEALDAERKKAEEAAEAERQKAELQEKARQAELKKAEEQERLRAEALRKEALARAMAPDIDKLKDFAKRCAEAVASVEVPDLSTKAAATALTTMRTSLERSLAAIKNLAESIR